MTKYHQVETMTRAFVNLRARWQTRGKRAILYVISVSKKKMYIFWKINVHHAMYISNQHSTFIGTFALYISTFYSYIIVIS